jgi:hypothetical protein
MRCGIAVLAGLCWMLLRLGCAAETIRLECEDFAGPWREQTNIAGYSGRGFVVSNAQGVATTVMTKRVPIPEAGTYHVWARGWEGGSTDRRWRVQVGKTLLDITHAGQDANRFSWQRCGQVQLPEGEVEIRLIDAGDSYEVADAMMLTTDPTLDPTEEEARWRVLPRYEAQGMVFEEIMARTRAYAAAMPVPKSRQEWRARASEIRPRILRALGLDPLPERTPLNATILGEIPRDGYRIQRVTFESRPGMTVTANVYVPDGEGPFPLVLCPVGHWGRGKNEATPAARNRALAKLGYITITYDPFGQEERNVPGNGHDEAWRLPLTGHCNMSIMVWDTVRALDYMLTREDVDGTRIACTGASGGGLNTLYTSVVDERLDVAVPVVYITQWQDFFSTGHAHCPCSHVPGLGQFTDMGEMTALFAPRPQMYMGAEDDPDFLPRGARRAEAQARVVYDLLGADENLRCLIFPGGHDYGQPMREALYGFLEQHLRGAGDGSPIPEPPDATSPPGIEDLWCFEGGKVPSTSNTVRQLAQDWAKAAVARLPRPDTIDVGETRAALIRLLHPPRPAEAPTFEEVGDFEADGLHVRKLALRVQPGIELPALLVTGKSGAPAVIIADASPDPMTAGPLLSQAHDAGLTALYVSPRGWGETTWSEHVICTDNLLLGNSILGQRAYDLAAAGRALKARLGGSHPRVSLLATGPEAGLAGLFAQAMWGEFDAAAIGPVPESYLEAFGPGLPMMAYVADILSVADIPQVTALAAQRPLRAIEGNAVADALAWLREQPRTLR